MPNPYKYVDSDAAACTHLWWVTSSKPSPFPSDSNNEFDVYFSHPVYVVTQNVLSLGFLNTQFSQALTPFPGCSSNFCASHPIPLRNSFLWLLSGMLHSGFWSGLTLMPCIKLLPPGACTVCGTASAACFSFSSLPRLFPCPCTSHLLFLAPASSTIKRKLKF